MTDEGIVRLKDFEGLRLKPYVDTVGKTSIGWGRNLDDRGISYDEASLLLTNDLNIATAEARLHFDWFDNLDPIRRDFIVIMIYNIGVPRLRKFKKMLAAIADREWLTAGAELVDSVWAKQVGENRTNQMRKAIERGEWLLIDKGGTKDVNA